MKKFFALVLAVAMIMSMAAVSMAADTTIEPGVYGPFDYGADDDRLRTSGIQYGDTVLFLLVDGDGNPMTDYKQVEKLKLKVSYEMGEDLVEKISIVKKYVSEVQDLTSEVEEILGGVGTANSSRVKQLNDSDYFYFIGVKVADTHSVNDADVIGTFELDRKEVDDDDVPSDKVGTLWGGEIDEWEYDFEINLSYNYGWLKDSGKYKVIDDNMTNVPLDWDEPYALKFDYDDEVEFVFGVDRGGDNEGSFTVDVSGQGKLYLKYNTKLDDAIADANPGVKIFALNFNGVKWNRTGEFAYEMEDGVAAYKVVDGQLVEIPGCEYDESDETFYFNTRVLENYVFATAELVNPVAAAPVVDAPVVEAAPSNPSTGA